MRGILLPFLRLLAQNNAVLREHLVSGARNAKYTSKTIQNEIIEVAADYIRSIYRDCINKCPHFSIMGDEVSFHGKEILSVCLRFLEIDHENFQKKAKKSMKFCLISNNYRQAHCREHTGSTCQAQYQHSKLQGTILRYNCFYELSHC